MAIEIFIVASNGNDRLKPRLFGGVLEESTVRPREVMTTGEAATILGVRSVFTIKRWAREGILDGFRRGGRILVTRESVERLLRSPKVAEERAAEADLSAVDAGDEPVPPMSWTGRKPWLTGVRQETDERAKC